MPAIDAEGQEDQTDSSGCRRNNPFDVDFWENREQAKGDV